MRSFVLITCILTVEEMDIYTVGCSVQLMSHWIYLSFEFVLSFLEKNVSHFFFFFLNLFLKLFRHFLSLMVVLKLSMKTKQ